MATMSKKRKAVIAGGVVVGVVIPAALFGYWHVVDSRNPYGGHNSYGMRDYTPAVQEEAAQGIVAGLNTGNPDNVWLTRFDRWPEWDAKHALSEARNALIRANITAVLPDPGCRYVLDGVEDKGEQEHPADLVPWSTKGQQEHLAEPVPWYEKVVDHAWGFDMKLRQLCPGQQPTPRAIRVIAIASEGTGYWVEAALQEQP
jgi:hypothetical protein